MVTEVEFTFFLGFMGLEAGLVIDLVVDGVLNILSSCCLDIFSLMSIVFNFVSIFDFSIVKFLKFDILYISLEISFNKK